MGDEVEIIDWKSERSVRTRITTAKRAVSRACTAINKLVEREWTYSTPNACEEARKKLNNDFDFCVKLHDRWSDLAALAAPGPGEPVEGPEGQSPISKKYADSIKPYEEKYYAALTLLDEYVAANAADDTPAADSGAAGRGEAEDRNKMNAGACKLLFPEPLTKSKTPEEFRLWTSEFRRFAEASGLLHQKAATQQGYLLKALDLELRKCMAQKYTKGMTIYNPGVAWSCLKMSSR